jgi:hypothetical protein
VLTILIFKPAWFDFSMLRDGKRKGNIHILSSGIFIAGEIKSNNFQCCSLLPPFISETIRARQMQVKVNTDRYLGVLRKFLYRIGPMKSD